MKRVLIALVVMAMLLGLAIIVTAGKTSDKPDLSKRVPGVPETVRSVNQMPVTPSQGYRPSNVCTMTTLTPPNATTIAHAAEAFGLTQAQAVKLGEITRKYQEDLKSLKEKAIEVNRKLREAIMADNFNAGEVKLLTEASQKAEAAIVALEVDAWTKMRGVLKSEQVKMMRESLSKPMGAFGGEEMVRPSVPANPADWPKPTDP